jgi:Cu/Ag efflux pump CusA
LQRFGCELLIAEDVHGGGKMRTADRVVPMTVAGRLLHAQQEQGSALRIDAKAINAVHCGVAVPAIRTGIGGQAVSQVFIGDRRYDTTVRFPPEARGSPEAIGNLVLTSSSGALIPVSQVAQVGLQTGESTITREMNQLFFRFTFS